ncbi:YraN family protein [Roseisalinus antarcticus]|uniref:UPF0102 protein ROA7023_00736 n=1 Tax=Roseisalinus antarcticus TaxID=254357 RepID=A0A1Y5RRY5_9RHOB|nr:YraN family protein [Roseisalinus antarcticus]SLN24032.1 hypothetical protein ROA7023_00736 [Roseisalinus antarcticus]
MQPERDPQPVTQRRQSGQMNHHGGASAEQCVAADYARRGRPVIGQRWRGTAGEIDLIAREGDSVVFVEVKKSRSHAAALARISRRQMERIMQTAQEFLGTLPTGQLTDIRFDVAVVDSAGRIEVLENAFAGY